MGFILAFIVSYCSSFIHHISFRRSLYKRALEAVAAGAQLPGGGVEIDNGPCAL